MALNCVANGKVLRDGKFDNIWIHRLRAMPAGLWARARSMHIFRDRKTNGRDSMSGAFLGPSFSRPTSNGDLRRLRAFCGFERGRGNRDDSSSPCKSSGGRLVPGPNRIGPRSLVTFNLGGSPLAAHAEESYLKVKYGESFRPFAPSVLREDVADWFELNADSPYMLIVADVCKDKRRAMTPEEQGLFEIDKLNIARSEIPAVTHLDYTARVQTVHAETNPLYYRLIQRFKALPVARSLSIRASTFVGNRLSARQRTPSAASWATNSIYWWSVSASLGRHSKTRALSKTTAPHSTLT